MKIKDVMTSKLDVIALESSVKVIEAADIMVKERIGSVIVVSRNIPIGIVTEKDIIRLVRQFDELENLTLEDIMTHPVITITDD